jgi:hypothetical protein
MLTFFLVYRFFEIPALAVRCVLNGISCWSYQQPRWCPAAIKLIKEEYSSGAGELFVASCKNDVVGRVTDEFTVIATL